MPHHHHHAKEPGPEAPVGTHIAARKTDLRTPCPVLNALANAGHLPRDGRNITERQLYNALRLINVGPDIAGILVTRAFQVHQTGPRSLLDLKTLGLRDKERVNDAGEQVIDFSDFSRPHSIEHDVSLSRQDRALGNPTPIHEKSVKALLTFPKADPNVMAVSDWGRYRKMRYEQFKKKNPELVYTVLDQFLGAGEAGLIVGIFGKGAWYGVPVEYIRAIFKDERLPYAEGWKARWTPLLLPELLSFAAVIREISKP